jgi:hypothetical protein
MTETGLTASAGASHRFAAAVGAIGGESSGMVDTAPAYASTTRDSTEVISGRCCAMQRQLSPSSALA